VASDSAVIADFQDFHQYRFTCTVDKLFSSSFLELVKTGNICLRSVSAFSEQGEFSVLLDFKGNLSLTMSQRVYESTGLDAAQVIVDSVHFSSTTRLLSFDLLKLSNETGHLKRIRERSAALASQVFSCEFVALSKSRLDKILGVSITEEPLPKLKSLSIDVFGWSEDHLEVPNLQEKVEWMSLAVRKPTSNANGIAGMALYSLEGIILPSFLVSQIIEKSLPQATHLILSARIPVLIPPHPHLNKLREVHFSASKYDPTTATADQQGFFILKSPSECSLFTLNTTA
jgi:hypothetical protein